MIHPLLATSPSRHCLYPLHRADPDQKKDGRGGEGLHFRCSFHVCGPTYLSLERCPSGVMMMIGMGMGMGRGDVRAVHTLLLSPNEAMINHPLTNKEEQVPPLALSSGTVHPLPCTTRTNHAATNQPRWIQRDIGLHLQEVQERITPIGRDCPWSCEVWIPFLDYVFYVFYFTFIYYFITRYIIIYYLGR